MDRTQSSSGQASRRLILGGVLASSLTAPAMAQDGRRILEGILQSRSSTGQGVTSGEADSGLREALTNGAIAAALRLGRNDGYWGDRAVRIPLPGSLGSLQRNLSRLGMSGALDDLQLKINRGAEQAAPQAVDVFRGAIRGLDINDVFGVLRGGPTAATQLLDTRTRPQLITLFAPPVRTGLDSSGASNAMDRIQRRYGSRMGTLAAVFGDGDPNLTLKDRLTNYAVGKALDGLFFYVGEEEKAIRADPAKRTTDLLRRVFGL